MADGHFLFNLFESANLFVFFAGADGVVQYTVLWLPRRYSCLLSYVLILILIIGSYCLKTKHRKGR